MEGVNALTENAWDVGGFCEDIYHIILESRHVNGGHLWLTTYRYC